MIMKLFGRKIGRRIVNAGQSVQSVDDETDSGRRKSMSAIALSPIAGSAFLVASTAGNSADAAAPAAINFTSLLAPRDGYIGEVSVGQSAAVLSGAKIAVIESDEEDRTADRIDLATKLLALQAENMSAAQIDVRRRILKSTLDVATAYEDYASSTSSRVAMQAAQGYVDPLQPHAWKVAAVRAAAEKTRAQLALDLFEHNVTQVQKKLALVTDGVEQERAALKIKKARLTLLAPIDGTVTLYCFKGSFLRKGDLVAKIA